MKDPNGIQFKMTTDIAYQLGKLDFPHLFYDIVMWKVNKEPFPLAHFFRWQIPGGLGGWPCSQNDDGDYITNWEEIMAGGTINRDLIDTAELKLAYIRGRLASYSVNVTENKIHVGYANSYGTRDFFVQCVHDVLTHHYTPFSLQPTPKWEITRGEGYLTVPGTPYAEVTGDAEVIKFLIGDVT